MHSMHKSERGGRVKKGVGAAKVCTSDKYETSTVRKNDLKWLMETYPLEVH